MDSFVNRKVQVGQSLSSYRGEELGYGLYIYHQQIHASVMGVLKKNNKVFYVDNHFPIKCVGIQINDIIGISFCKYCANQYIFYQQTDLRMHTQRACQIKTCGSRDFIKARVISLGDSLRNLYLTTAGQDLGVLVAKNQNSERLMLPYDWESMIDPNTNQIQKRKVAKPEFK